MVTTLHFKLKILTRKKALVFDLSFINLKNQITLIFGSNLSYINEHVSFF